jgi:NAD-dependent deacetylase
VVVTGAGISAESGIPTFRGEEGYWTVGSTHYHPTELATNRAFQSIPEDSWCWYLYRRGVCNRAQPNSGHQALVQMEAAMGGRFLLVTQNVDGLHRRAGNSAERVYEVHGNINRMRCWQECTLETFLIPEEIGPKEKGERLSDRERELLVCPHCQGRARPHVLWFDEAYDEERFRLASSQRAVVNAEVLVTVGSSGSTTLPMRMARLASAYGVILIDINTETNPFAQLAQSSGGIWMQQPAGQALNELLEILVPPA